MTNHLVIFIGSDGRRAATTRSAATQASLVLRDLLDRREPTMNVVKKTVGERRGVSDVFDDFIAVKEGGIPTIELPFPHATGSILGRICAHMTYRYDNQPLNETKEPLAVRSSYSKSDRKGCPFGGNIGRNVMPEIPRPMVLPLMDYLDCFDQKFIEDWDDVMTVQMVKLATLLNYEELLNLASAKLASCLLEKSVEGLRTFLGVESDFDSDEEAALNKEYGRYISEK
uniref:SKP1 component dimerisation domain-containing protein n=1 Tax=Trypanosoma congolense (strain IL3000) TaxID=1068625 RepID=G0UXT7_TRYCI|nr:conserved hypothetical protein [Trypanosoma congolense IL3000]